MSQRSPGQCPPATPLPSRRGIPSTSPRIPQRRCASSPRSQSSFAFGSSLPRQLNNRNNPPPIPPQRKSSKTRIMSQSDNSGRQQHHNFDNINNRTSSLTRATVRSLQRGRQQQQQRQQQNSSPVQQQQSSSSSLSRLPKSTAESIQQLKVGKGCNFRPFRDYQLFFSRSLLLP